MSSGANDVVTVTLDTSVMNSTWHPKLREAIDRAGIVADVRVVTVSERERGIRVDEDDPYVDLPTWVGTLPLREVFVLDESLLVGPEGDDGRGAILASEEDVERYDAILEVITNGWRPKPREEVTPGRRSQIRDTMIFDAHCRANRDVFITGDTLAFVEHDRREALELIGRTRIVAASEVGVLWP